MQQHIMKIYQGVMGVIEDAKHLVDDTKIPDTVAMKKQVEQLCHAINDLPLRERLTYQDQLNELFAALISLEEKLKAKREEVGSMLVDTPIHKSANKAYSKVEYGDNKTKNKPVDSHGTDD